jgi:hypothetical protein
VQLAEASKIGKSQAYEAVNVLVGEHVIHNIGSDTRPRYVVSATGGGVA